MGIARSVLLAGSQSAWLRERARQWGFVRRSVTRFMPGETVEDAIAAAREIERRGLTSILTYLGENVTTAAEAAAVTAHYEKAQDLIATADLDAQLSVKLTQLGLDLGLDGCAANLLRLAERAAKRGDPVWIDMESSSYVDRTLEVYRSVLERAPNLGVCLQAYLHRTPRDVDALLPLTPRIRLVKGAYREAPSVAIAKKSDVDEAYFRLATRFLAEAPRRTGAFLGIATHDSKLIARVLSDPAAASAPAASWEIEMLYGIGSAAQRKLASESRSVRVLISYGESWFPWYMRRLAERPANVWFVMRNLFKK